MATVYHDEDADLAALAGAVSAVIGYGNQGRSQALNLRDSGLRVIVGNIGDAARRRAAAEGFAVYDVAQAAGRADVALLLVPDEIMPELYAREVGPRLRAGACVSFASGYCVAFGPVMGLALRQSIELLIEEGYPPEAVLVELYMSGELAYAAQRFVDTGLIAQMDFHSHTSQYGSMTRSARLMDLDLKPRLRAALDDIRSGRFAEEWSAEQRAGLPLYNQMKAMRDQIPLAAWEREARKKFRIDP